MIKKIIISDEYNANGLYKVKLRKLGFWVKIILDDFFPCYPEGGPVFGKSD